MPTDLIFFVVEKAFRVNRYLFKTPLGWDSTTKRFTFDNRKPKNFFWWYFTMFVLFAGVNGSCFMYVVLSHLISPRPGLNVGYVAMYVIDCLTVPLLGGITLVVLTLGNGTVILINRELETYEELEGHSNMRRPANMTRRAKGRFFKTKSGKSGIFDKLNGILNFPGIYSNTGRLDVSGSI